jgi:hypothetical protein
MGTLLFDNNPVTAIFASSDWKAVSCCARMSTVLLVVEPDEMKITLSREMYSTFSLSTMAPEPLPSDVFDTHLFG